MSSRILLVEDEPGLVVTISDLLRAEGYHVDVASDGEMAVAKAGAGAFDLIVLDVMLPKKTGFEVCRELRQKGIDSAILMLTAKTQVADRVMGLKLGADDYLIKPFNPAELLAASGGAAAALVAEENRIRDAQLPVRRRRRRFRARRSSPRGGAGESGAKRAAALTLSWWIIAKRVVTREAIAARNLGIRQPTFPRAPSTYSQQAATPSRSWKRSAESRHHPGPFAAHRWFPPAA